MLYYSTVVYIFLPVFYPDFPSDETNNIIFFSRVATVFSDGPANIIRRAPAEII